MAGGSRFGVHAAVDVKSDRQIFKCSGYAREGHYGDPDLRGALEVLDWVADYALQVRGPGRVFIRGRQRKADGSGSRILPVFMKLPDTAKEVIFM